MWWCGGSLAGSGLPPSLGNSSVDLSLSSGEDWRDLTQSVIRSASLSFLKEDLRSLNSALRRKVGVYLICIFSKKCNFEFDKSLKDG